MKALLLFCKRIIEQTFRVQLRRIDSCNHDTGQIIGLIKSHDIDRVFDVGANVGQFAMSLLNSNVGVKITSFEPNEKAHKTLRAKSEKYSDWDIAPRYALGSSSALSTLNVSSNSVSSSLLEISDIHLSAEGSSRVSMQEKVTVTTLDEIVKAEQIRFDRALLKIDTQGYEKRVLEGAVPQFKNIELIILELSFVKLYEDQPLWTEVDTFLNDHGYYLHGVQKGFVDPYSGLGLQFDGIYVKK